MILFGKKYRNSGSTRPGVFRQFTVSGSGSVKSSLFRTLGRLPSSGGTRYDSGRQEHGALDYGGRGPSSESSSVTEGNGSGGVSKIVKRITPKGSVKGSTNKVLEVVSDYRTGCIKNYRIHKRLIVIGSYKILVRIFINIVP